MGKKFRIIMLAMLTVCMVASMAMAGTTTVNHGAAGVNYQAGREALGSARTLIVDGAAQNGSVTYVPGQVLTSQNLLQVTLTNATFNGGAVRVCTAMDYSAANQVVALATATPTATTSQYNFQLNLPSGVLVQNGDILYLSSSTECAPAASAATNRFFTFKNTAAPAGNGTIKIDAITAGALVVDSSTAATLYTVASEYGSVQGGTSHTIDFLQSPANGTKIINTGTTIATVADSVTASAATNSIYLDKKSFNYGAVLNGLAGSNAALTVGAVVSLTDTAAWQGVSNVYLTNGGVACTTGAANVINSAPSGTVALTIPSNAFNGTAVKSFNLCVTPNGTSALQTRIIQSSVDINVTGTGATDVAATAYANAQTWGLNAYQALIPWIINSASAPTYCLINNNDTVNTMTVLLDVTSSEGSVIVTNANLGTVAAKTSKLSTYTNNSVSLTGGTATDLTTIGANGRYSTRVTLTVNPASASMACIQTDPITGAKRVVPVLTYDSANAAYKN